MASIFSFRRYKKTGSRKRTGSLTLRILSLNLIAPLILVAGLLYIVQHRDTLIAAELETLEVEAQLFAGLIAEGAVTTVDDSAGYLYRQASRKRVLVEELSRRMVRSLSKTSNNRTRLFNENGELLADSHRLIGPDGIVNIATLPPPADNQNSLKIWMHDLIKTLTDAIPTETDLPIYTEPQSDHIKDHKDAKHSLTTNESTATAWQTKDKLVVLTAAAPIVKNNYRVGTLLLSREAQDIENAIVKLRADVLTMFLASLSITIFLSLYLASVIGRPLRKLAIAAEIVRIGKGRRINMPDLSHRNDEIGELSQALHDMTRALRDRMDAIEKFAADVSHELKNPLSSLRSAVETVAKVTDEEDRKRLLDIIAHDVQRLDRLISDISKASRIDAELNRDDHEDVDLANLLSQLSEARRTPLQRSLSASRQDKNEEAQNSNIVLIIPEDETFTINGIESQLAQVFDNLITNALSFSPEGESITITMVKHGNEITVTVDDKGPGIPENKLEDIFQRFYSERPKHEDYGSHSGLGLSIARQIVTAHNGTINAQNLYDEDDDHQKNIIGARFTVTFRY